MNTVPTLAFHYAIQFPDGLWYYGPTWVGAGQTAKALINTDNRGPIAPTYTYSQAGAHRMLELHPKEFEGCTVVKVLG